MMAASPTYWMEAVNHYDILFSLQLTDTEKADLVEYVQSLGDGPRTRSDKDQNGVERRNPPPLVTDFEGACPQWNEKPTRPEGWLFSGKFVKDLHAFVAKRSKA